ncbi:transketolase [Erysipelotrichaceae bacterium]|nr:transketolase [Erysipelotrichaceae bacterium]
MKQKAVDAIRVLGIDAIEKSKSGHPGIVMGAAPMVSTLWTKFLRVNPNKPTWFNRDRFVLSAGHGSMLLYSLLHLSGFDLSMEDLKNFRVLDSKTPGHPEFHHTPGIDATTGPLGQGIAMAVGMALAEKKLAATYNMDAYEIIDHYTYALCGDGDLMEGISSEAASFAGLHKLGKLVVLYDSNNICLDGQIADAFTDDILARFRSYGWQAFQVEDGTDLDSIEQAIKHAQAEPNMPTLIEIKTVIGQGSIAAGTNAVHGAPLGSADAKNAKLSYGWNHEPFEIPEDVYTFYKEHVSSRGEQAYNEWATLFNDYAKSYPEKALQLQKSIKKVFDPIVWQTYENGFEQATRNSSQDCIQIAADNLPFLFGGSADLSHSNMTFIKNEGLFLPGQLENRNIQFGVREFAMAAIANGLSLHGGLLPYVGTFFVFSDYLKPALRLSALMQQQVLYILTHDSIAVGEDGPTHEPIEQLAMLRSIPNVFTFRPADARETVGAWHAMLHIKNAPSTLVLTRQNLPVLENSEAARVVNGGYIVHQEVGILKLILMAAGSEVALAIEVAKELEAMDISVRVVSMPSMELFNLQSAEYRESILPKTASVRRMAIEMAHPQPWYQYLGLDDIAYGITTFGASGNATDVLKKFGFTKEQILEKAKTLINK